MAVLPKAPPEEDKAITHASFLPGARRGGRKQRPDLIRELWIQAGEFVSKEDRRTKLTALVNTLYQEAIAGNEKHAKLILDRLAPIRMLMDGKVTHEHVFVVRDMTGEGPKQVEIPMRSDDDDFVIDVDRLREVAGENAEEDALAGIPS